MKKIRWLAILWPILTLMQAGCSSYPVVQPARQIVTLWPNNDVEYHPHEIRKNRVRYQTEEMQQADVEYQTIDKQSDIDDQSFEKEPQVQNRTEVLDADDEDLED